jgi:predicted dehydrogenase
MSPIRVALAGLSSSAKVTWAADAHLSYLLSPFGKKHYQLIALLNSSTEAAQAAKKTFHLSEDVKTYGDAITLAEDPDIDLLVVCTRVDVHFSVAEPSLKAGKALYIEWPLTQDLTSAQYLANLISDPRNSIIGLQGRVAPITLRLKDILALGTIGKVLSSQVRAFGTLMQRDTLPESLAYFTERKVGGHPINIHYGHMIDYVHEVLGGWQEFHTKMQIQRPELKLSGTNGMTNRIIKSDVPDLISAHGTLRTDKGVTVPGATLTASFRLGQAFKGEPGFVWYIAGEMGELRVTAPGPYLMSGDSFDGPIAIDHHDYGTDEVRDLGWNWPEWQKELGLRARSVAEVYERYAEWVEGGKGDVVEGREWPRVEDGVGLMEEFDEIYREFDGV